MDQMKDLYEVWLKRLPEEIHDANAYWDMAISAFQSGDRDLGITFFKIGREEKGHAYAVYQVLLKYGIAVPQELKNSLTELCDREDILMRRR